MSNLEGGEAQKISPNVTWGRGPKIDLKSVMYYFNDPLRMRFPNCVELNFRLWFSAVSRK